jgi:hypothetical protein
MRADRLYVAKRAGYGSCERRQLKIARRLDPSITFFGDIPEKPKGMWWRTYHRLARGIASAEDDIDAAFTLKVLVC